MLDKIVLANELRAHYLAAMDIIEWRLRPVKSAGVMSYYQATFTVKNDIICLLADANLNDENITAKEKKLLQAILFALGIQTEIVLNQGASKLSTEKITKLILMGDVAKQFVQSVDQPEQLEVITTHSLKQLLVQPALKGETWKALRKLQCIF